MTLQLKREGCAYEIEINAEEPRQYIFGGFYVGLTFTSRCLIPHDLQYDLSPKVIAADGGRLDFIFIPGEPDWLDGDCTYFGVGI